MPATSSSAASILKRWYRGPVKYELNDRTWAFKNFKKSSYTWNGSEVIVPVHTSRNTGVGYRSEDAAGGATALSTLPDAGNQGFENLTIPAKFFYGRFQLSGPSMSKAKSAGQGSFLNLLKTEMDRLVIDVSMSADARAITGGPVRGLICEQKASSNTSGAQLVGTPANCADDTFIYDGDYSAFFNVNHAAPLTWVRVKLIDMNTYEEITGTGASNDNFWVSDVPTLALGGGTNGTLATAGTIMISYGTDTAGASSYTTVLGDPNAAIAVQVHETAAVDSAAQPMSRSVTTVGTGQEVFPAFATAGQVDTCIEPAGVLTNLCTSQHFGVDRTAGNAEVLQSTVQRMSAALPGARTDLELIRIQQLMDQVLLKSGKEFTILACSPLQRARYVDLLTGVIQGSQQGSLQKGNGGLVSSEKGGLSYGGLRIWTSQHIPNGMWLFLTLDSWEMATLETGDFADLDGAVLSRMSNTDRWEGFWRMYYNTYTASPNSNAALCGVTL